MAQITLYLTGIAVSLVLGAAVASFIRKPLRLILVDLCGTEDRAAFWTRITLLSYLLVSAALALGYRPDSFIADYYYLGGHLGRTLSGLLITTGFLAMTISTFIRRQERMAFKSRQAG
jgi:hypothetical protein